MAAARLELATVTGDVANGMTATLTVAVGLPNDKRSSRWSQGAASLECARERGRATPDRLPRLDVEPVVEASVDPRQS